MKLQWIIVCIILTGFFACKKPLRKTIIEDEYGKVVCFMDQDSLMQGLFVRMNSNGDTTEIAHYVNDKLEGERRIFTNGFLEIREQYVQDVLEGSYETYYNNGQINIKTVYQNGVMNDKIYKYFENGVLAEVVQMKDNEENGPFVEYYPSGKLHWEGNYINGDNEDGILKKYSEDGELIEKLMCGLYHENRICQTIWDKERGDVPLKLPFDE